MLAVQAAAFTTTQVLALMLVVKDLAWLEAEMVDHPHFFHQQQERQIQAAVVVEMLLTMAVMVLIARQAVLAS